MVARVVVRVVMMAVVTTEAERMAAVRVVTRVLMRMVVRVVVAAAVRVRGDKCGFCPKCVWFLPRIISQHYVSFCCIHGYIMCIPAVAFRSSCI